MRLIFVIAYLLLAISVCSANVTVDMARSISFECAPSVPVKNADGTYAHNKANPLCETTIRWKEEWTDLPERGGTFVKKISPDPAPLRPR